MPAEQKIENPSDNYLRELGLLTIRWANLEAYVDLLSAYLAHETDQDNVPRPFSGRLKFIRRKARHPALVTLQSELFEILEQASSLGRERNNITHGITVAWKTGDISKIFSLRESKGKYIALLDDEVSLAQIADLNNAIDKLARKTFGMLERLKAIFKFLKFEESFVWLNRLDGDRG